MGYDSDAPLAHGEVGKVGVAIDSIEDMRTLLRGIPLDTVPSGMSWNRVRMSSMLSMATPTLPTSPCATGASES
ncbi:MAG: methylmalonyl-CoA mutase family protein [Streptosporangiaceae bacterium]